MKNTYKILFTLAILLTSTILLGQGPGAPPATPIDGGLSLLLAAGALFGVKKLREGRSK